MCWDAVRSSSSSALLRPDDTTTKPSRSRAALRFSELDIFARLGRVAVLNVGGSKLVPVISRSNLLTDLFRLEVAVISRFKTIKIAATWK